MNSIEKYYSSENAILVCGLVETMLENFQLIQGEFWDCSTRDKITKYD